MYKRQVWGVRGIQGIPGPEGPAGGTGGSGQGFQLVDTLSATADIGTHERLNSDSRGYFRGMNTWTQVDGQQAIELNGDFCSATSDGTALPEWEAHPTQFTIGVLNG